MYKIGQKVQFDGVTGPIIGYIVKMEILPLEEIDVASVSKEGIIYTIRVYKPFYVNGYTDFGRMEGEFRNADD